MNDALAHHLSVQHRLGRMRQVPAPPIPRPPTDTPPGAPDVPAARLGATGERAPRDGARRVSAIARVDRDRLSLRPLLDVLGWSPQSHLLARIAEDGQIVVSVGEPDRPTSMVMPSPSPDLRLRLSVTVLARLDVRPGDQVLAIAVPDLAELHLWAAADIAQVLTPVAARLVRPAEGVTDAAAAQAAPRGVRPRWQPPAGTAAVRDSA